MAGSEFVEVLVGVGSARIRDLFMRAKVSYSPDCEFYFRFFDKFDLFFGDLWLLTVILSF